LILLAFQCSEPELKNLSSSQLEQKIITHPDFNSFITLHSKNIIALGSLEKHEENLLIEYYRLGLTTVEMRSEIESLFEKIGFREQALISYRKIVTFLDSKFQYNKSDL
jgi:hypothetical protein